MRPLKISINPDEAFAFNGFIFNDPAQIDLQKKSDHYTFFLLSNTSVIARFNLFIQDKLGLSPFRAPFGSIEFDDTLTQQELNYFLIGIMGFCKAHNLKRIKIVSYPECYAPKQSKMLERVFYDNGFTIKYSDLNYDIPINGEFVEHLHLSEKRRLNKCLKENFIFKLGKGEDVKKIYELIKNSRERKGFPISMSEEEIAALFVNNPDKNWSFTLWDHGELVAVSIGVQVSEDILYYFLPADNEKYKTFSPSVLLLRYMYDFCVEKGMKILDLGIATSAGQKNEGLIRFKENLGGLLSFKYTFEKEIF